ncbi:MAG: site-specific integrase [archaeon]|nr:site-specific integrase [archaeon]
MKSGNIYKVKEGTFRLRYMHEGVMHSKNIKAANITEAKQIANKIIKEINCNETTDLYNATLTFTELTQLWFDNYYKTNCTPEVVKNAKISLNSKILPKIGNYKVSHVTPIVLNEMINEFKKEISPRTRKPLSQATIKKLYNYISSIYNYALRMDLVENNPCDKVKVTFKDERVKNLQFYTAEQVKILFDNMQDETLETQLAIKLAVYAGLRRSEIYGIKWSDIDFKNKTIHIQRTRLKVNGTDTVSKTKTVNSNRIVTINDEIIKMIKKLKQDSDFIFIKADRDIVEKLHRIQYKASLPRIKFHDLRHTSATLLLANGIDVKSVSEYLGHANISTTSIYVHALDEKHKIASDKLTQILK